MIDLHNYIAENNLRVLANEHYAKNEAHPTFKYSKTDNKKWPYILTQDLAIDVWYINRNRSTFDTGGYDIRHKYFCIDQLGLMIIKKGYSWNGANKPAITSNQNLFASLIHDVICQATNEGLMRYKSRAVADKIFYCLMRDKAKTVADEIRAAYSYAAVRSFTFFKGIFNRPKYRGNK